MRTPGLILGFRGFKSSSNFGDSCFSLNFETSYVALFNGLMISGIRILVLHVYCLNIGCLKTGTDVYLNAHRKVKKS